MGWQQAESLGSVVSALVREALRPPEGVTYEADLPVFQVKEDSPPITPEMVESALEES